MEEQISIFDNSDKFVLDTSRPIKLFEAFAGIGCQRLAFNRLGLNYASVGISEIDKFALKSYQAIHSDCNNFGSICDIKGYNLPEIDVFTWSFPCTDLSKAGKQKGLTNTRSGLVYEVLRIMQECKVNGNLPKVLIMENVVDLVQTKFIKEFNEIQLELEEIGYSNFTQKLNAKNYGVAQNRDRVFMVSILNGGHYEFPKPEPLAKRLKDYLEDEVDEKYYLSDTMLKYIIADNEKWSGNNDKSIINKIIASTINTCEGSRRCDASNYVSDEYIENINIKEATSKGYKEAYEGDSVNLDQPNNKTRRGRVGEQQAQTLTTSCNQGVVENLRIRKLTPLECWRLMGIDDNDFYKAQTVCSNAQLYKQAGNGIVVDVFAKIIKEMLPKEEIGCNPI